MEPMLVGVTLFSLALALAMTVVAWKLLRDARDREHARMEALRAGAFDEVQETEEDVRLGDWDRALASHEDASRGERPGRGVASRPLAEPDFDDARSPMFEAATAPTHTRWLAFAAVALVMVAAAVTVSALHSPEIVAAVTASRAARSTAADAQALQLLSLRQAVDPDGGFTVTGLVENPPRGERLGRVQAVVYLFDASGRYFASGHANLEVNTFAPGDESPFVVRIPSASGVSRYRVGFRQDDGSVVAHVDRRGQMPTGMTGDAIDAAAPRAALPLDSSDVRTGTGGMSVQSQSRRTAIVLTAAIVAAGSTAWTFQGPAGQAFSFNTGVALINVSATVTDENGRFVSGLTARDFEIYEDGAPQPVQQFEAERVPVSLGIALDTSGSMYGEKIAAAQTALNRFLFTLLGPSDQVFLYRFSERPLLVQGWTTDRSMVSRALGTVKPEGETALYDTVAEAVSLAETGSRQKKAVVVISDGNDNRSRTKPEELVERIRKSDVLVYAIGIDASAPSGHANRNSPRTIPVPTPFPGKGPTSMTTTTPASKPSSSSSLDRVNPDALHAITDDSGGRTEIVASPSDLDPVTAGIADELSRQYFLGYSSPAEKDGRWHTIEVRLTKPGGYVVRARRGFIAN